MCRKGKDIPTIVTVPEWPADPKALERGPASLTALTKLAELVRPKS